MNNHLAQFFQQLATNPQLASRFADPEQRMAVLTEAQLSDEAIAMLCKEDADGLHNLMANSQKGTRQPWQHMLGNTTNSNNDISRFKRRASRAA